MTYAEIIARGRDILAPFETGNVVKFIREMNFFKALESPLVPLMVVIVFYFIVIRRSKFMLLFLFALTSLSVLAHYTLPDRNEAAMGTLLPFAAGCLSIGAILIYFNFIRTE